MFVQTAWNPSSSCVITCRHTLHGGNGEYQCCLHRLAACTLTDGCTHSSLHFKFHPAKRFMQHFIQCREASFPWLCVTADNREACFDISICLSACLSHHQPACYVNWTHALDALVCCPCRVVFDYAFIVSSLFLMRWESKTNVCVFLSYLFIFLQTEKKSLWVSLNGFILAATGRYKSSVAWWQIILQISSLLWRAFLHQIMAQIHIGPHVNVHLVSADMWTSPVCLRPSVFPAGNIYWFYFNLI